MCDFLIAFGILNYVMETINLSFKNDFMVFVTSRCELSENVLWEYLTSRECLWIHLIFALIIEYFCFLRQNLIDLNWSHWFLWMHVYLWIDFSLESRNLVLTLLRWIFFPTSCGMQTYRTLGCIMRVIQSWHESSLANVNWCFFRWSIHVLLSLINEVWFIG